MLRLLLFVLPLGLDTLGVSISLGIKSHRSEPAEKEGKRNAFPPWLGSALLFSLAETVMPVVGLALGYAVSLLLSSVMHILGPLLLIGVGLWELLEEIRERISKRKEHKNLAGNKPRGVSLAGASPATTFNRPLAPVDDGHDWGRQLLLALSVSLDELAIGFSLGAITSGTLSGGQVIPGSKTVSTITFCILIGLQGFLMTFIGLTLGRTLRVRLKFVKEWTEFLSCFLLIALGIWLLIT